MEMEIESKQPGRYFSLIGKNRFGEGMYYAKGFNCLQVPFREKAGGYFYTSGEYILDYVENHSVFLVEIFLPLSNPEFRQVNYGKYFRSNMVIVKDLCNLRQVTAVKLMSCGIPVDKILEYADHHKNMLIIGNIHAQNIEVTSNDKYLRQLINLINFQKKKDKQQYNKKDTQTENFLLKVFEVMNFYIFDSPHVTNYRGQIRPDEINPDETIVHDSKDNRILFFGKNIIVADAKNIFKVDYDSSVHYLIKVKIMAHDGPTFYRIYRDYIQHSDHKFSFRHLFLCEGIDLSDVSSYPELIKQGFDIDDMIIHAAKRKYDPIVKYLYGKKYF